jgi:hypothetical protein
MRLLVRTRDVAHLEVWPDALGQGDLPELSVDLVGRVLRPELEHGLDGLDHHLGPQLGLADVEDLEVADQPARPDAHDEAPLAELIEHGGVRGHVTGWLWGKLSTPVPKRICCVRD